MVTEQKSLTFLLLFIRYPLRPRNNYDQPICSSYWLVRCMHAIPWMAWYSCENQQ